MSFRFGLSIFLSLLLSACYYYIYPLLLSGMNPLVSYLAIGFGFLLFVGNVVLVAKVRSWPQRMILTTILITCLFTAYHLTRLRLEERMQKDVPRRYYSE